ncbi:outer membrane beta-barrel protein [Salinimicrobium oceani]|uniref:TonB-dependent receptor n=1 Tax=Salinimicrobium oceani TaxID=2722702 RepID=A0ABX1CZ92_9FLAO|nr:outer membrane beta-barrel protein [Salinimicrobium oceani]NJW53590.1 TonB-dependent receptor [Salinimicrobium oceani]
MKHFFFLCLFLVATGSWAQQFKISGKVVDAETQAPLESATLFVEKVQDSSLVSYTISSKTGNFVIEGSEKVDTLRLVSTYNGYKSLSKTLVLKEPTMELGVLKMEVANNLLGEVTVISERAPVTVKADTLEFNAASFNTRQDANLEEVMKKLPGVEIDAQGNITVNGKPVSRILVNGKEFFGNDPKIATKNLPKEIIDKIQVVDTKTKSEEFTGKAGDPENKTINVTIKEDKNKGYFSRFTAGGGTDERYELSGIANYFKDDLRVSVLASSNNINSSGFSMDEVFDMMRGRSRSIMIRSNGTFAVNGMSFGSDQGITKSETAGLNFTNDWGEKLELTGDYFFGKSDTETASVVERETFLPNSTFYTNIVSDANIINENHRANLSFEVELDTMTRIELRPSLSISNGFAHRTSASERIDSNRELLTNTDDREDVYNSDFNNRIGFTRKFGKRGAYLEASFENTNQLRESENFFYSELLDTEAGELVETRIQDQFIDEENTTDEYEAGISQRAVLAEKLFLDLSYDFSTQILSNTRNVLEFNEDTREYDRFNEVLSNDFEVKSLKHIPNAGVSFEGKKLRAGFDVGLLSTSLENTNFLADVDFKNTYNNLFLRSNVRYEIERGKTLYADFRSDTEIPSIRELQPVPNLTDPLNIIIGNPELRPEYSRRFHLGYQNFDFATRSGMSVFASATIYDDQVVPYSVTGEDLVTTTTYRNVDGGISSYAGVTLSKRFKKEERELSYRLGIFGNYNRQIGFSNGFRYNADRYSFNPSLRLGYNYNDLVEINPRYEMNYNQSRYDINFGREEEYTNHTIALEATTYWPKNVVFGNDVSFISFGNVAPGFDSTSLLWNMSLGYKFLADNATLKVKVYDLLNENVSTRRVIGDDYVQDTQELILEQYFMVSFTYKLSRFGGKDPNRGRGRGGIFMF